MSNSMIVGTIAYLALFIGATWLKFKLNERAFNRRNQYGIEQFSSYSSAVFTRLFERVTRFFCFCVQIGFLGWCFFITNIVVSIIKKG